MRADIQKFFSASQFTAQTKNSYGHCLKRWAEWLGENDLDPAALDPEDFHRFLNSRPWSSNTRRLHGNALKSFLRWRYGSGHPCAREKLPRDDSGPQRTPSVEQLHQIITSIDTSKAIGWRDLCIIELMLETGLRLSEMCRLEVRHLDLEHRCLSVLQKGTRWRSGIFTEYVAGCLATWLAHRRKIAKPGIRTVFVSIGGITPGMPLNPEGIRTALYRRAEKASLGTRISPHDLRRAMVCLCLENGAPTKVIQNLGGWRSIQMVERYARNYGLRHDDIDAYSPVMSVLSKRPD